MLGAVHALAKTSIKTRKRLFSMTANRVIFIDDDLDVRTAIGQSLELEGYDVVLARAFIEATDHITPGFPGIIVTDVRMPGKDGFDLLERALKIDRDLPVIVPLLE